MLIFHFEFRLVGKFEKKKQLFIYIFFTYRFAIGLIKLTIKCLVSLAYDLSYCLALALQVLQIGKLARSLD